MKQLECWQLTCQFPTCKSPVLCRFDRDNSMYEQQTWMLTLGLLNRNTGCQCCSVRCSSMLKLLCISIHNLDFQNFNFSTVRTVKRVELYHNAKFCWNRSNRGQDMAIFRFLKMADVAMLDFYNFKFLTVEKVKKVEVHRCAKFRRNRLNCAWTMVIFRFLRWRPPPSWIFKIWNF